MLVWGWQLGWVRVVNQSQWFYICWVIAKWSVTAWCQSQVPKMVLVTTRFLVEQLQPPHNQNIKKYRPKWLVIADRSVALSFASWSQRGSQAIASIVWLGVSGRGGQMGRPQASHAEVWEFETMWLIQWEAFSLRLCAFRWCTMPVLTT